MEPSELAAILAVLRDAGATSAELPVLVNLQVHPLRVTLAPAQPVIVQVTEDDEPTADEDLPPGAYDPIAARKKAS